jgi:hypothetical protein
MIAMAVGMLPELEAMISLNVDLAARYQVVTNDPDAEPGARRTAATLAVWRRARARYFRGECADTERVEVRHELDHRRPGQLPTRQSNRRQGGEAPDLTPGGTHVVGRKDGHQWGEIMAAAGEKQMAVDRRHLPKPNDQPSAYSVPATRPGYSKMKWRAGEGAAGRRARLFHRYG